MNTDAHPHTQVDVALIGGGIAGLWLQNLLAASGYSTVLIEKASLTKTRQYIRHRLPGLIGERVVDSKFNQVILTPDTHFIVDWHPQHENVLLAGGCSGHLFKHGPVFGDFTAGVALREYGTADRFKIAGRKKAIMT